MKSLVLVILTLEKMGTGGIQLTDRVRVKVMGCRNSPLTIKPYPMKIHD